MWREDVERNRGRINNRQVMKIRQRNVHKGHCAQEQSGGVVGGAAYERWVGTRDGRSTP